MKYCELTASEKAELRDTLFWASVYPGEDPDFDGLSAEQQEVVSNCDSSDDIPEDIMEAAYGCYDFVEEDFFCNVEDQFCDRLGNPYDEKHIRASE